MLNSAREFVASHRDVSQLVRNAKHFSIKVPVVGKVSVPPPEHLAFYGVLGILGATELIPWPVALGLGVGHALTVRHTRDSAAESAHEKTTAKKAPAKKAPAKKAPAKKTTVRRAPATKAN